MIVQLDQSGSSDSSAGRAPKRILQVVESACAGVGGHVLDLVEGLSKSNCKIHLMYSPLRIDNPFRQRLEAMGNIKSLPIKMRRRPELRDLLSAKRIRDYVNQHGPFDVIHAHSTKAGGLVRLPFVSGRTKTVYTPNGIFTMNQMAGKLAQFVAKRIEISLAKRCSAIIAVSPEEKEHMHAIGFAKEQVHFIANGIRQQQWPSRDEVRRALNISPDKIVIGFLGRLAPQKNPLLLIKAFADMNRDDSVCLAIGGDGPLAQPCRQLARKLNVDSRIQWLGFKTAQETMPAFDVFAMPSRYEGMPYVMMEALSVGLPIVATNVGGTGIGVEPDVNGFIVPNGESDALSFRLQALVDSKELRKSFGEASLTRAKQFSVEAMIKQTLSLYERLP